MLSKRIIPCLDVKDSMVVKGVNFKDLVNIGDPLQLAKYYDQERADELIFLDISATVNKKEMQFNLASRVAKEIFIPFAIGGGINNLEQMVKMVQAGADKLVINSAAVKNPDLIKQGSLELGSQCIVVAIDVKKINNKHYVFINAGQVQTELLALDWAKQVEILGAGEIVLTSIDKDGTKQGFDLEITKEIGQKVKIPVIASGGVGKKEDFLAAFDFANADGALAASLFHSGELKISEVKEYLIKNNVSIRK